MPVVGMNKEQFDAAVAAAVEEPEVKEIVYITDGVYKVTGGHSITFPVITESSTLFSIMGANNELLVSINRAGKVTIHKPELVDEAAIQFWAAIQYYCPQCLKCSCKAEK